MVVVRLGALLSHRDDRKLRVIAAENGISLAPPGSPLRRRQIKELHDTLQERVASLSEALVEDVPVAIVQPIVKPKPVLTTPVKPVKAAARK